MRIVMSIHEHFLVNDEQMTNWGLNSCQIGFDLFLFVIQFL